jgi:hypothetical protein
MLVDYERVVLELKRELQGKRSWGQRELMAVVTRLEVECAIEEGPSDTVFRLFSAELEERLFNRAETRAATPAPSEQDGMPTHLDHRDAEASRRRNTNGNGNIEHASNAV